MWGRGDGATVLLSVSAASVCDQACGSCQSSCCSSLPPPAPQGLLSQQFYLLLAYFLLRLTQVSSNINLGDF